MKPIIITGTTLASFAAAPAGPTGFNENEPWDLPCGFFSYLTDQGLFGVWGRTILRTMFKS
jgi:hypothetical protein